VQVTEKGLEDQILALVVRKERRDLAELGEALVQQQNGSVGRNGHLSVTHRSQ
jgi:hypothetical protein